VWTKTDKADASLQTKGQAVDAAVDKIAPQIVESTWEASQSYHSRTLSRVCNCTSPQ
jgi:hypothetical protein